MDNLKMCRQKTDPLLIMWCDVHQVVLFFWNIACISFTLPMDWFGLKVDIFMPQGFICIACKQNETHKIYWQFIRQQDYVPVIRQVLGMTYVTIYWTSECTAHLPPVWRSAVHISECWASSTCCPCFAFPEANEASALSKF